MPRVELAGGVNGDSATQFSAEECINMRPIIDTYNSGKGNVKLVEHFGTIPIGGLNVKSYERLYWAYTSSTRETFAFLWAVNNVASEFITVVRYDENGVQTTFKLGTISTNGYPDKIEVIDNGTVLSILVIWETTTQYHELYFYNFATESLDLCTTPSGTWFVQQTYKDTYFAYADRKNGRFYISDNNASNPLAAINPLDFGTLESNPDKVNGIAAIGNELAVFGDNSIEFFYNSGNVDFPFERNSGVSQDIGLKGRYSIQRIRNKLYFLGADGSSEGTVFVLNGYIPEPLSNQIGSSNSLNIPFDVFLPDSYSYYDGKHATYILYKGDYSVNEANYYTIKYAYDVDTGLWSTISLINNSGEYIGTPSVSVVPYFSSQIQVGVQELISIGKDFIYGSGSEATIGVLSTSRSLKESQDTVTEAEPTTANYLPILPRLRTLKHMVVENRDVLYKSFELDIQKDVANVDDADPTISISMSKDGGMTFGTPKVVRIGGTNAQQRIRIKRLGRGRDVVFKIESSSPVQQEWFTAYLEYEVLDD